VELEYTDEQRLLSDTLDELLEKHYEPNARLRLLDSDAGWSRELWARYAELGLLGLPFDEAYGGAGMGPAELSVVMECFGRALVLEPYLATVVLGAQLVARAGSPEQKSAILPRVAAGDLLLAFAHTESGARWSSTDIATVAAPADGGWTLTGQKIAVLGADSADRIVVTAKTPSGEIGLFLVDGAGARRAPYAFQDGLRGADVLLQATPAEALGTTLAGADALESVLDIATAVVCAEAVGAMERMLWLTVEYLKTRVQFGQPISTNQALQHRAADMFVALEQARSMALLARLALAGDDVAERRRTVRAAKIQVDLSSRHIGQEAVQLHGGIGMTWEYPVGHYLKRAAVIARTFGSVDDLLESVGAEGGLISAR
jgi:alkylation response protein AidB-like acyl-CoA dehydrogenase